MANTAQIESENDGSLATHNTSGKRITLLVLLALVVTVVGLSYVLGTYNSINQVRDAAASNWRAVVDALANRHRSYETDMARGVDSEEVPMEVGERFRLALDRFRTSSRKAIQFEAALEIESIVGTSIEGLAEPDAELASAISSFNDEQTRLDELVNSPAGKILTSVLLFDDTSTFELAGS